MPSGSILPPLWSSTIVSNLLAKAYFSLDFLGDRGWPVWLVTAFLFGLLLLAAAGVCAAGRQPGPAPSPDARGAAPAVSS